MSKQIEGNSRRAFVLDDEPKIAAVVGQVLQSSGYESQQFCEPTPFLVEVRAAPPHLIVLDLALGKSDAVEIMRHLAVLKYRGKVLLMSGRDEVMLSDMEKVGQRHGLVMLPPLQKPFRGHDLKNRIAQPVSDKAAMAEDSAAKTGAAKSGVAMSLRDALRNDCLELWYQPKIELKSLSVCGAEALLRARHPEHGVVAPSGLLPQAGDPLYAPLSKFVIERSISDWKRLARESRPLKLAVNIPISVAASADFISVIREHVPADPRFPGLIVEITEDEIIRDLDRIQEVATQLKLYNVRLAIDDFGSAYSSLSRLRDLPCIELKLDRSFVSGCSVDGSKMLLCSAAIDLAHGFGLTVCAEGVEDAEDLRVLIEMRCDTAQGFLFAKPLPFERFLQKLGKSGAAHTDGAAQRNSRLAGVA
jgi:EAL domain-containing protein (putative c-di-GMP-specific phosphodiesterase class I)/ActR/RegA family two-component response regulator